MPAITSAASLPSWVALREHRLAHDVADGEDVRHVGAHLPVDGNPAAIVDRDAGLVRADALAVRTAPHREQHAVVDFRRRSRAAVGIRNTPSIPPRTTRSSPPWS
jgi:hypothetical protein